MAKKRDHKAEYARRKALAQAKGYSGLREYKRTRKRLALPRRRRLPAKKVVERYDPAIVVPPNRLMARMRRESQMWSDRHSHVERSRYNPSWGDRQVRDYHKAYVEYPDGLSRRKAAAEKRRRIGSYVNAYSNIEAEEWEQNY